MINGINEHVHQKVIIKILSTRHFFFPDVTEITDDEHLQCDGDDDDDDDASELIQQTLQVPANSFSTRESFV